MCLLYQGAWTTPWNSSSKCRYFVNPSYPAVDSKPAACSLVASDTCWVSHCEVGWNSVPYTSSVRRPSSVLLRTFWLCICQLRDSTDYWIVLITDSIQIYCQFTLLICIINIPEGPISTARIRTLWFVHPGGIDPLYLHKAQPIDVYNRHHPPYCHDKTEWCIIKVQANGKTSFLILILNYQKCWYYAYI